MTLKEREKRVQQLSARLGAKDDISSMPRADRSALLRKMMIQHIARLPELEYEKLYLDVHAARELPENIAYQEARA